MYAKLDPKVESEVVIADVTHTHEARSHLNESCWTSWQHRFWWYERGTHMKESYEIRSSHIMESRCLMIASMSLIRHVTTKAYPLRLLQVYSDSHSGRTHPHTRIYVHTHVSCYNPNLEFSWNWANRTYSKVLHCKQIELPTKQLDYLFSNNTSNINQFWSNKITHHRYDYQCTFWMGFLYRHWGAVGWPP